MSGKNYYVVSHTHWDREWYEPFDVFRYNLVKMMDYLLDTIREQPNFKFNLDCQSVIIEDYLEVRPQKRDELMAAIRNGNITIGPWYIQNDFFQTSGESTIRNILLGTSLAREWGFSDDFVGYAPDHGGMIAQLPQILKGCGVDSLVFGRGRIVSKENGKKNTFIFESPDGSQIITVFLFNFYNSAQRFSIDQEKAVRYFKMLEEKEKYGNSTNNILLMNGVDHLFPQADLEKSFEIIRKTMPEGDKIFQSTLADYIRAQKKDVDMTNIEVHKGEIRTPLKERLLCPGTISCRIGQKGDISRAEDTLFIKLQGLCSMLVMAGFGEEAYDRDFMNHLWKLIIQNLPHDSIWGCNADSTNRHIIDRTRRFEELSERIFAEKLRLLSVHSGKFDENCYKITVVNPFPFAVKTPVHTTLDIASDDEKGSFKLFDTDGTEIAYSATEPHAEEHALRSPVNLPGRIDVMRREVTFTAELPAFGYKVLKVVPCEKAPENAPLGNSNGIIKVEVHPNGRVDLTDLVNNRLFKDMLSLEDNGDLGDTYSYKPFPEEVPISTSNIKPLKVDMTTSAGRTDWTIDYELELPESLTEDRSRRSDVLKKMPVSIKLTMYKDCPYLEVNISGNNTVKDHFLRAVVKTNIDSGKLSGTGAFELAEYDCNRNPDWLDREFIIRDFVEIQNEKQGGMALLTGNLHSSELFRDKQGRIALGLVRSTGYIFCYYEVPKDKTWIVPENQVQGKFNCRFGIMPCKFNEVPSDEMRMAQVFAVGVSSYADYSSPEKFSGGRPCVQDSDISEIFKLPDPYENISLPHEMSFIDVTNSPMLHSSVKLAENSSDVILRIWNPEKQSVSFEIKAKDSKNIYKTNFLENKDNPVENINDCAVVPGKAGEIITLKIKNK